MSLRTLIRLALLVVIAITTPPLIHQLETHAEIYPVLVELDRLRPLAAAQGVQIPSDQEILDNYHTIQIPSRPRQDISVWPKDLAGIAWDYSWAGGAGLTQTQLQAILYARKECSGVALGSWTTDTQMPAIMLSCDRSYMSASYAWGLQSTLDAVAWQPGEDIAFIGDGPGAPGFAQAKVVREEGDGTETVFIQDVNPGFEPIWRFYMKQLGWPEGRPVVPVIGTEHNVNLPEDCVDVIVLANMWYYVVAQESGSIMTRDVSDDQVRRGASKFFASVDKALRPGGRVIITAHHWPNYPPEAVVDQISRVLGHTEYRQLAITRLGGMESSTAVILQNGDRPTLRMPLR